MDKRAGAIWAYRFILNREPESDDAIDAAARSFTRPEELRRALRTSKEFSSILERAGQPITLRYPSDWREGVLWAYRLFLRREPNEDEINGHIVPNDTVNDIRLRFLLSQECEIGSPGLKPLADFAIVNAFAPFLDRTPIDGAFQDIFGSITKVEYLDRNWRGLSGHVYRSVPRQAEHGLHGTAEWIGTLRSVLEAKDSFTAIELGAGWAPWLVVSQRAAQRRGIEHISLTGVEGSAEHYGFMLDNFRCNSLEPSAHALHRAVVGAQDGVASFPRLHVATDDYGANAVFGEHERGAAAQRGDLEEVRSISLNTLLADKTRVDLIHIDIQGHEEDVIRAAIGAANAKVRRMVIGTHSRAIEGHLFDLLQDNGWICEYEAPCGMRRDANGRLHLVVDGEQVWRNPRIQ